MSVVRVLVACSLCAAALGVAFVALLALALLLPDDTRIEANLRDAVESGVLSAESYPSSPFGAISEHQYDMYTDCVAFGMNLSNRRDGVLRRIAVSPTVGYQVGDAGPCGRLVGAVTAGDVRADFTYLRFWHGYQILVRPLLSLMSLDALRRLIAIAFCAVLIFFSWRLSLIFGPTAWAVTLPFFALSDFLTAPMVLTHAVSLIWAFLPAALVPLLLARAPNARALVLPVFVFAAGATYNFLNFLINPPLAPALIAFVYIACTLNGDERQARRAALYAAGLAALWFAGFAAAWVEKWAFAALVLGPEAVINHLSSAVTDYETARVRLGVNLLGASRRNVLSSREFFVFIVSSVVAACALVAWTIRKHGAPRTRLIHFIAMLAPLAVIVLWVEANSAHSAVHVGFVSRSFVLFSVIPILAAIKVWRDAVQPAVPP